MPATRPDGRSKTTTKIRWLGFFVILAVAVYTGGWFYAANAIGTYLKKELAEARIGGNTAECPDLDIRGYPFRIGVFCSGVKIDDHSAGASLSFGKLRSATQIYDPGHAIVELDGPAEIRATGGLRMTADWSLLHSSLVASLDGLKRASVEFEKLAASLTIPISLNSIDIASSHGEFHTRQNGEDLDIATSLNNVTVDTDLIPQPLPVVSGSVDMTLFKQADLLRGADIASLRGSKGQMRQLVLDFGDRGSAKLAGDFDIGSDGLLSGTFQLNVSRIDDLKTIINASFPDISPTVNGIASLLKGLSKDGQNVTVNLSVAEGAIRLSLFPIGHIPAI